MAVITRQIVAEKIGAYLRHDMALAELIAWAESAMMEGEFEPEHFMAIRDVVGRLGVADVRAFGLTWEDCQALLGKLGYAAHVSIVKPDPRSLPDFPLRKGMAHSLGNLGFAAADADL